MKKLIQYIVNWLNAEDVNAGDTGGNIAVSFVRYGLFLWLVIVLIAIIIRFVIL